MWRQLAVTWYQSLGFIRISLTSKRRRGKVKIAIYSAYLQRERERWHICHCPTYELRVVNTQSPPSSSRGPRRPLTRSRDVKLTDNLCQTVWNYPPQREELTVIEKLSLRSLYSLERKIKWGCCLLISILTRSNISIESDRIDASSKVLHITLLWRKF